MRLHSNDRRILSHGSTRNMVTDEYFIWLLELVDMHRRPIDSQYIHLFHILHAIDFYSDHPMDVNRTADGESLRDRYDVITNDGSYLTGNATVLEVILALSIKFHDILYDAEIDDPPSDRFWEMIDNMGLMRCTDDEYGSSWDDRYVCDIIARVLDRDYDRYGSGSLFPVRRSRKDHRKMELWYQMHDYIDEKY